MVPNSPPPRVFISYSHDSTQHLDRVLSLANRMRGDGVDAWIDQYETNPAKGWSSWMREQIEGAKYVLMVCTETYKLALEGKLPIGVRRGAKWEGAIITRTLYLSEGGTEKFIPILFARDDTRHIPIEIPDGNYYDCSTDEGYENLYRLITDQPAITAPPVGPQRRLLPRDLQSSNPNRREAPGESVQPIKRRQSFVPLDQEGTRYAKFFAALFIVLLLALGCLVYYNRNTNESRSRQYRVYVRSETLPVNVSIDGDASKNIYQQDSGMSWEISIGSHTLVALSGKRRYMEKFIVGPNQSTYMIVIPSQLVSGAWLD